MTTWSVVKEDTGEKQGRGLTARLVPRIALLACIALVALGIGVALTPGSPKPAAEPPFSEQARAAALSETLRLRAAVEQLGSTTPGAGRAPLTQAVTLLTTQARALLSPGGDDPAALFPHDPQTPSDAAPTPASAAGVATELAAGAGQRLADAAVADGGMARLLAAVGTAQLLQASALAAGTGASLPAQADPAAPQVTGTCPAAAVASAPPAVEEPGSGVTAARALEATVRTEQQNVYGYQLALTRLRGEPAKSAASQLARHEALLAGARSLSLGHCLTAPPPEAGYSLSPSFLAAPAAGLAGLEARSLPVYGDLVALSEGDARRWAISALLETARGAVVWGAEPGPLPGLPGDPESFPPLPAPTPPPARSQIR
jgi:hypothetical protein